jgi:2-oxoglutarate ferredoxin oxidoreductase subunit beta
MNIPYLAGACGAVYVARWTILHIKRLTRAIKEAILKPGFSIVEIIAPCSTLYARKNRLGTGTELLKFYHDNCEIQHGADLKSLDLAYQDKIICGKFVDKDKPTYLDVLKKSREEVKIK